MTYGADHVRLETKTNTGASTSGQLLLTRPGTLEPGEPFKLQVTMLVESVYPHDQYDAGAAIMGSFAPPFGTPDVERRQMIYLDAGAIGWADDMLSPYRVGVTDNAYHVYELSVDASKVASLAVDGKQALSRTNFTTNGAIAIGDQTNNAGVDSVLQVKSVAKLCP